MSDTTPQPLDWSKLPDQLQYLAVPATKYGQLQFEDRILDFLEEEATEEEIQELKKLEERVSRDWTLIDAWLDDYSMVKHREAALVYFTGHLLALGKDEGLL